MSLPPLTTVDGAYRYLMGLLLVLVLLFGLFFGAVYLDLIPF